MKKLIICFGLLLMASLSYASVQSVLSQLYLQVRIVDPTVHDEPIGRGSVDIPSLRLEGYNLLFNTSCDGCTLRLLDRNGDVEYSIVIPAGTTGIELPSYLSGEYEIQIIREQYCFYGDVEL